MAITTPYSHIDTNISDLFLFFIFYFEAGITMVAVVASGGNDGSNMVVVPPLLVPLLPSLLPLW